MKQEEALTNLLSPRDTGTCGVTLEDPVVVFAVEDPGVVVTPPLTLAPVVAPTLVTELAAAVDAVEVEWVLAVVVVAAEAVVVAGFAAAPAVDDDAASFCNADIKLTAKFWPLLTAVKGTTILANSIK